MNIELGQEVEDRVTGFKGIAVSMTAYLQGCNRVGVAPPTVKDGDLRDVESFDEPDLIVIGDGILPSSATEPPGGPRFTPSAKELR